MTSTIRDVAKQAGVGVGTVSRVLNQHPAVSDLTRQRVLAAIQKLNYVPSQAARRLSTGKTMTIGVVAPFFSAPAVVERLRGIEAFSSQSNYDLTIYNVESHEQKRNRFQELLSGEKIDGVLIISLMLTEDDLTAFKKANIPVVIIDADTPTIQRVCINNRLGGFQATQHLIQLGHTRIGFVSGQTSTPLGDNSSNERLVGYKQALERAGIPINPQYIMNGDHSVYDSRYGGYELTYQLMHENEVAPTAIVAASDMHAMGALKAAGELGLDVPYQLSIIGYDDIEMAAYLNLTTIKQPLYESGKTGAELLIKTLSATPDERERHTMSIKLIVRGTTARAAKKI